MDSVTSGTNSTCGGDETRREIFGKNTTNKGDLESSNFSTPNTYNKTILTSPDELTFAGVVQGQLYL